MSPSPRSPRLPVGRALGVAGLALGLLAGVPSYAQARVDGPAAAYEMPFPCGQSWTGATRSSHSPSARAIDFNRPDDLGQPVVASAPGVVRTAVPDGTRGYGRYVVVDHEGGASTWHAHLAEVSVVAGQRVDQGALLGTVGSTGNSSGPHLHYEQRVGSALADPWFHGAPFAMGSTQASQNCVDVPVAGNFLGTAPAELVVFRRAAQASFEIMRPGAAPKVLRIGTATDQPVAGDWDGDGRLNPGVRTPSTGTFVLRVGSTVYRVVLGEAADVPVAGDWDGDGQWDVGVRRARDGVFVLRAMGGGLSEVALGDLDDLPVTGDWDGDGDADLGVYDVRTATFTLRRVDDEGLVWVSQVTHGSGDDLPVTGDWDGNGRTDLGVWDPTTATFTLRRAAAPTSARAQATRVRFGRAR